MYYRPLLCLHCSVSHDVYPASSEPSAGRLIVRVNELESFNHCDVVNQSLIAKRTLGVSHYRIVESDNHNVGPVRQNVLTKKTVSFVAHKGDRFGPTWKFSIRAK